MVTHLKILRIEKGKGKVSERTRQSVEELEYLVTFNRSISQAMQHTIQDLSEGIFISMANLTLARRDSYLKYLCSGVKQDTLTALHTAPVHLQSLFPDQLLVKVDEISCSEERHSSGSSHRKPSRFHPYASSTTKPAHQLDQKSTVPVWKQRSGTSNRERKDGARPQPSNRNRLRVLSRVNDNYCVQTVPD